jgi:hypothetical protein
MEPMEHCEHHYRPDLCPHCLRDQLAGAVEAVRAHYDGWVKANGRASGNMRPADRALWIAVLGPEFGGQ